MTLLYAVQWPLADDAGLVPKWTHSVLSEHTFQSEWEAQASASFLAFELGHSSFHAVDRLPEKSCKSRGALRVSFAAKVHVLIGLEDSVSCCSLHVFPEVLDSPCKPWSLRPPGYQPCPVPQVEISDREPPVHRDVQYHFIQIPEADHPCWVSCMHPLEFLIAADQPDFDACSRDIALPQHFVDMSSSPGDCGDPLSAKAVLISSHQCIAQASPTCVQLFLDRKHAFDVAPDVQATSSGSCSKALHCLPGSPRPISEQVPESETHCGPPCVLALHAYDAQLGHDVVPSQSSVPADLSGLSFPCAPLSEGLSCLAFPGDPLSPSAVLISESPSPVSVDHVSCPVGLDSVDDGPISALNDCASPASGCTVCSPAFHLQVPEDQLVMQLSKIRQHKVTDESDGRAACLAASQSNVPAGFPFEFELPAFVREMLMHLPSGFLDRPHPVNHGPLVRVWFIHMDFQARSFQERQLQLTGPPQFWRAQIVALWFDALAPQQNLDINVVLPIPPRRWHERSLVFDILLSQGNAPRKKPTLVTVLPSVVSRDLQLYSGAVVLGPEASGDHIITGIAADRVCADRFCQVTFGHRILVNEGPPAHQVSPGNGFVVHVGRIRSQSAGSADVVVGASYAPMEVDTDTDGFQVHPQSGQDPEFPFAAQQGQSSTHSQPSIRATLYALHRPSRNAMVRLDVPHCLWSDIANVYGVHPSHIAGLHVLQVTPVGDPPLSVHIIVQFQGDLVPGSTDKLILLDVAFHCHGLPARPCVQTPVDRRVLSVSQHLGRSDLLDLAFVGSYCELVGHRCLVSVNRQPWNQQNPLASGFLSGAYFRIEVPPPPMQDAHTCHVVELVEDIALDETQPHFADHYPHLPQTSRTRERSAIIEKTSARHVVLPTVLPEHQYRSLAVSVLHIGSQHQSETPSFLREPQLPAPNLLPRLHDVDAFDLEFAMLFRDYALTERLEEGQVAYIATWYVHHDHHPVCLQGRLIRISSQRQSWFPELCRPWLAEIRRFETLAVRIVRPAPPPIDVGPAIAHVILEQGLYRPKVAALSSILVQAFHGDSKHQRAQSLPGRVSAHDLYRASHIEPLCAARICSAWSGVIRFRTSVQDDIFSGIGIHIDVRLPRDGPLSGQGGSHSMFNAPGHPAVVQFHRVDESSASPPRALSDPAHGDRDVPAVPLEHVEGHFMPNLRTAWEQYLITAVDRPYVFQVEVWYCDHDRFPRSDISRIVTLPIDPTLWKPRLLQAWDDCVDPAIEAFFYVVDPTPIGGTPGLVAHVIVAQNQHPGFISSLITTIVPGDDPWHPHRIVLRLPSVVDHWILLAESYLLQYCPPFVPANRCNSWWGAVDLTPGNLFPAHSGYGFLCTASPAPIQVADLTTQPAQPVDPDFRFWFDAFHRIANEVFHILAHSFTKVSESGARVVTLLRETALVRSGCQEADPLAKHQFSCPEMTLEGASLGSHELSPVVDVDFTLCDVEPLRVLWQQGCTGSSRHKPFAVCVWYSDHLRHAGHHSAPVVYLEADVSCWPSRLLAPWAHCIDPTTPVSFFVNPHGALGAWDTADAHVTIVQNPLPDIASVLLAVFDPWEFQRPPQLSIAAVAVPVTVETIDRIVAQLHPLLQTRSDWHSEVWVGTAPFGASVIDFAAHGTCLTVCTRWTWDPWVGLSDLQFSDLIQTCMSPPPSAPVVKAGTVPVVLSLQAVLPVRTIDPQTAEFHDELPTISILEKSNWRQALADQSLPSLWPLPEGFVLPPASYWAFLDDTALDPQRASWAELYVDGSTSHTGAAWSVVVVQTDGIASRFVGTLFGRVEHSSSHPAWIGASSFDNISAEFSAFAIALDLACRIGPVVAVIRPDLQLSAHVATQQCVTDSNVCLAQLIAALYAWLPSGSHVREVRGHCAHPWNELADALARWALTHDPPAPHDVEVLHQLAQAPADLQWAWIQGGPSSLFQALPPVVDGQVCQFPLSLRKVPVPEAPRSDVREPSRCQIQVISINVLALDPLREQLQVGRQRGHRTARLDEQWHKQKVHIVGMQEARTLPGRDVTEHYCVFSSGFEAPAAPRFGCEVWIHRSLPLVSTPQGVDLLAADFKFVVIHADPRRLFVRGDHQCCSFLVCVLHAPCLGKTKGNGHRPIDDISQWWTETSDILQACSPATFQWFCVDANAPLASQESECFGTLGAEPMNAQGHLFEEFLLKHHLAVPSTFSDIHQGESWTWTHSSGSRCRRDYILVPVPLLTSVHDSFTLRAYDGSFSHDDHIPVGLHFAAFLPEHASSARLHWNELAFLDPTTVAQFQEALATLPVPTWDVRTTDHCAVFEAQVVQLGQQFFGGRTKKRFRPQLQPSTLDMIAFKRHLLDVGRALELMTDPTFKAELRAVEKVVRAAVYADLAVFYDQLLVRLQNADQSADAKQLYRILDRLGRKRTGSPARRPLPILKSPEGALAQTFQQQQHIWLRQFAVTEAGLPMSWQSLYSLARPGLTRQDFELDPQAFISPWQILQAMRKLRRGKACGPNGIPPDLLKAGGAPFAMLMSCLTNKVTAHAHEPTSWRGGKLIPLYKGKGSPCDPSSFRSIFISDFTAKLYHACLRRPLERAWSDRLHSMQYGGRAGCGVDIAHHFLQMHQCWARHVKTPAAIVFFGMKAAFYSVLRQALTTCEDPSNAFQFAMQRLGLAESEIHDMLSAVENECALEGVSSHVERLVHDTMSHTFFTVEGVASPVATHLGTRPGDPIGDLLFNLTMSKILAEMKDIVIESGVATWFGDPARCSDFLEPGELPAHGFADVSFVDDCAVAIHSSDLGRLQAIAQQVVSAMHVAARRRGLHLNYEAGKTEMLWHVQGKGSRTLKQQLMRSNNQISWSAFDVQFRLRVVLSYRHLGTWIQAGGCLSREIQQRASGAKSSWGSLARQFFSKKYVSVETKVKVFRSLALSRHMYNAHTWAEIKPADLSKWANSLRQPLCSLSKCRTKGFAPKLFDVATLGGLIGLENPQDRLHAARLRYFARLVRQCPVALWQFIWHTQQSPTAWLAMLIESFQWFCRFYGPTWQLAADSPVEAWILAVQTDSSWKGRIKSALKKCQQYRQSQAEHLVWQKAFDAQFYALTQTEPQPQTQQQLQWQCDSCSKWFSSKKGLATHCQRVHGYRRLVRFFASGDTCPACCKMHHSRMRLCQHLTHSQVCMQQLQACFPPMPDELVHYLDQQDELEFAELKKEGWWRTKALLPACRVPGPGLPPVDSNEARLMFERWTVRFPTAGSAFTQLQGRKLEETDCEEPVSQTVQHPSQGYVMQSPHGGLEGGGLFQYSGLATLNARMNISTLVFVHFFSGYRRSQDLHSILEHVVLPNGLQLFALSVDMCLQKAAGDLSSDASVSFWRKQIMAGRVFGAGGGPPCESFTAARLSGAGPRAVRSASEPTGLPYLTAKEWRQVLVGTRSVQFILDIILLLAQVGGCGFCEHPQYPVWCATKAPCSLWSFPAVLQLRQLRCISIVSFDQCVFHAPAVKPTTVMLLRLGDFREDTLALGRCGRCQHGFNAHERLIGRDATGQFKTARGKVYPPRLNGAIGKAIGSYVERTFATEDTCSMATSLPDVFQRFAATVFVDPSEVQPDFHG